MGILDMFKNPDLQKVEGVVERFGLDLHETNGSRHCLVLVGSPVLYLIWSDRADDAYPIGLTIAGDKVSMLADAQGSIQGRDFFNDTLSSRQMTLLQASR